MPSRDQGRAHVSIDGVLYRLAQGYPGVERPYAHHYSPVVHRVFASQKRGEENLIADQQYWSVTDWSGGEGYSFWRDDDPSVYDLGLVNTRVPGKLKPPPARTATDMPTAPASTQTVFMGNSDSYIWVASERKAWRSNDGTTWADFATGQGVGWNTTAVAVDKGSVFLAESDGGHFDIRKVNSSGSSQQLNTQTTADTVVAMAVSGPWLFFLRSNGAVYRLDVTKAGSQALPNVLYNVGNKTSNDFADMVATDTGVAIMDSQKGTTDVHEIPGPSFAGKVVWNLPDGFTGRAMGWAAGALWCVGTFGARVHLYAFPYSNRQEVDIGFIRIGTPGMVPASIGPGIGKTVLVAMQSGEVFVYDAPADSLTQLDAAPVTGYVLDAVGTFEDVRIAAAHKTATNFKPRVFTWADDLGTVSSSVSGILTEALHDMNIGGYSKVVDNVSVVFAPFSDASTVLLEYEVDQSGNWVSAGTVSNANGNSSTGQVQFQVSTSTSSVKCKKFRYRVTVSGISAEVQGIKWITHVPAFYETWDLVIAAVDEASFAHSPGGSRRGSKIRDQLLATVENEKVVKFIDYYRYSPNQTPKSNKTVDVLVREAIDEVGPKGVGLLHVTLIRVGAPV